MRRRLSWGVERVEGRAHFRLFAPKRERVEVVLGDGRTIALDREPDGFFSGAIEDVATGTTYRYRLDDGDTRIPDPASRFQPEGPHGPSEVIDPAGFAWTDGAWRGVTLRGQIVYELHVGTFTRAGTFAAAMAELEELRDLGVTLIELMPVAEFPGAFGWGYDGVDLYAPSHLYGRPDDLRAFVDRAHALGVGVILDVVYNHLGPSGNYLRELSDHFFTERYANEWGDAIDFETERGARAYFAENGAYWIDEFHLDGLRLDATQNIDDASEVHVVRELGERARAAAAPRTIVIFAENEPQASDLARPIERGGYGLDALWNDDFHHAATVAATGHCAAYYSPTKGTMQELVSAVKWGFLFQGQYYPWQKIRRGKPGLDLPAPTFTIFLENHDQVSNVGIGSRLQQRTSPGIHRALSALLLLAPGTPLLFQGQEFASSKPFVYFADHEPELAALVAKGRAEFMTQFPYLRSKAASERLPAPHAPETFERCKLDLSERTTNAPTYALFRALLRLRREDMAFSAQDSRKIHGAILGPRAMLLRFFSDTGDRLVVVNLGEDLDISGIAEPLIAPPDGEAWRIVLSTEDVSYGGDGTPPLGDHPEVFVPGGSTIVLGGAAS